MAQASRLFRERGAEGTSVGDVMAEAGLTHGGFYRHFENKDALVAATIRAALDGILKALEERAAAVGANSEVKGCVARTLDDDANGNTRRSRFSLRGNLEEAGDKSRMSPDVAPVEVSNLALPDHREGLEACQGYPRRSKAAEAEPRPNQALDAPVVLLDDVVIWHV